MGFTDTFKKLVDPFGLVTGGDKSAPQLPQITDYLKPGKKGEPSMANRTVSQMEGYYGAAVPSSMRMLDLYGPGFMDQGFRFGGQGVTGFMGLQQQAGAGAAQQMADLRAQEFGTMASQAPMFRGFAETLSPEQAAMVQASTDAANRATASAQGVTPQEQRMYQQAAREAAQASGRLGGNAAIASEVMGRENVLAQKRAEADAARQRAFAQAGQFYTAPGLESLRSAPISYGMGTTIAGMGLNLGQTMTPQFDYNLPLGLARERAGAIDARNMAQYNANAQFAAQQQQGKSDAMGSIMQMIPVIMSASDRRLKTDINKVGKTNSGLPIYTYKYKGDPKTQMGVMAQDVEKKNPKAVKEFGGFKAVNYALIK
jgi:hypothetical protein